MKFLGKYKPFAITALVAIAAVFIWNKWVANKIKPDGSLQA